MKEAAVAWTLANSPWVNPLVRDYLNRQAETLPWAPPYPQIADFGAQIEAKKNHFNAQHRHTLVRVLQAQYQTLPPSAKVLEQVTALEDTNTFTVCTGHQLNLFGGPAFMMYKIVATLKLARQLQAAYPTYRFVPVFWLASEDHDFDEINHLYTQGQRVTWTTANHQAPVGRLVLHDVEVLQQQLQTLWGKSTQAQHLLDSFAQAYQNGQTLAQATLAWVHQWFADEGLVQIQPDHSELKTLFAPLVAQELTEGVIHQEVNRTTQQWGDYPVQAHARDVNLFYIHQGQRLRLSRNGQEIQAIGGPKGPLQDWIQRLNEQPASFSPNALFRPVYQECVLPNLAYVGGGAEISYWLQLQSSFKAFGLPFPLPVVRPSALVWNTRQWQHWQKLGLDLSDLGLKPDQLQRKLLQQWSQLPLDLQPLKAQWHTHLDQLHHWAQRTDPSFQGALAAFEKKYQRDIDRLEKRLYKAENRVHDQRWQRCLQLWEQAHPGGIPQERHAHFSDYYLQYGSRWWQEVFEQLDPLGAQLHLISLPI